MESDAADTHGPARTRTARRASAAVLAVLCLAAGCNGDYDYDWLPPAFQGDGGVERRQAFEAELADATSRFDYAGIDPAEIAYERELGHARCGGLWFRRHIIDGREETTDSHEALQPGRQAISRLTKIPYIHDPNDRFVVVRQIYKVDDRWEVIREHWVLLPPDDPGCRRALKGMLAGGEFAGAEDALGDPSAGRGFGATSLPPRGFKTRVTPTPRPPGGAAKAGKTGGAGQASKTGKGGSAGQADPPVSQAAGATQRQGSGLSIVKRPGMKSRTVTDANGKHVTIWGQTRSTSTTPGHDTAMESEALRMARSGDYEYITIQRSWRTATGRVSKHRKIPDIIGVRRDGKVDAVEVRSRTDKERVLRQRLREGMNTLPPERRGKSWTIDP